MNLIEVFLKDLKFRGKSDLTITAYRYNLNQLCDIMSLSTSDLNAFSIQMFYEYVDDLRQKGYSTSSINQRIGTLRSFYKFLFKHSYIEDRRYDSFGKILGEKSLPQFLEMEDAKKLIQTVRNSDFESPKGTLNFRDRLILEILLDTGVRVFELSKMKISDINFNTGYTFVLGKKGIQRNVRLSPNTLILVKEWLEIRRELKIAEGFEDYLIISSKTGQNLKKRQMQYIVEKYVGKSGVEKVSLHKLRHTYASIMLATGTLTLEQVQDRLGHKSPETTQLYVHALNSNQGINPLFA